MVFGQVRVSRNEQNQDLQFDALRKVGCEDFSRESVRGHRRSCPSMRRWFRSCERGRHRRRSGLTQNQRAAKQKVTTTGGCKLIEQRVNSWETGQVLALQELDLVQQHKERINNGIIL